MSVGVKLLGRLEFDDADLMDDALVEAAELLEGEDEDLVSMLEDEGWVTVGEDFVTIDLDVSVPADWFLGIDDIVEGLCDYATAGAVRCWYEDEETEPYLP